jgi:hypothetical protein
MRLQLLSDLHLESETFDPTPAPGADLLVLAGDIDATWQAFEQFRGWPVPVLAVAGNHEFDGRELGDAWPALRERCDDCGIRLLERESLVVTDQEGQRVRFVGTVRWSDFDLFGLARRPQAMRAAQYFLRLMGSTAGGEAIDAERLREISLSCRHWLENALRQRGDWDTTVAITHFGPSLRSGDPRFGAQPGTASFCNADDDLIPLADLWLHGHLHCRHDYRVARANGAPSRVVCNPRGLAHKGEGADFDPLCLIDLPWPAARHDEAATRRVTLVPPRKEARK